MAHFRLIPRDDFVLRGLYPRHSHRTSFLNPSCLFDDPIDDYMPEYSILPYLLRHSGSGEHGEEKSGNTQNKTADDMTANSNQSVELPIQRGSQQPDGAPSTQPWMTTMNFRGFAPEDVKVNEKDGVLTVNAKKEVRDGDSYMLREMNRVVTIPEDIDMNELKVNYMFDNGKLVFTAPRKQPALENKQPDSLPIEVEKK